MPRLITRPILRILTVLATMLATSIRTLRLLCLRTKHILHANTNNNVNYYNPSNNVILSQNDTSRGKSNSLSDSANESNTPSFNNSAALSTDQRSAQDQDQAAAFGGLLTPSVELRGLIPVLASAVAGYVVSYMLGSTQNQAFMSAGISGASYYIADGLVKWGGYDNEILSFMGSSTLNAGALAYLGADIGLSIGTGLISSAAASATKYLSARRTGSLPSGGYEATGDADTY